MTQLDSTTNRSQAEYLADQGYWPALAARRLREGRYADAISICRQNMPDSPRLTSGRTIYALALEASGQADSATEEFRAVLALDPDNLIALKALGDAAFASGETALAMSYFQKVLEIDPFGRGLKSEIKARSKEVTRTIKLARGPETTAIGSEQIGRHILFYTETIGDLYLDQGHPRLAAQVYRRLASEGGSPRLAEKLSRAESKIKEKEH